MKRRSDRNKDIFRSDSYKFRSPCTFSHQEESDNEKQPWAQHDKEKHSYQKFVPGSSACAHDQMMNELPRSLADDPKKSWSQGHSDVDRKGVKQMHHCHHNNTTRHDITGSWLGDRSIKGHFSRPGRFYDRICDKNFVGSSKRYSEEDKLWLEKIRPFSENDVVELANLEPQKLVIKLYAKIKAFQETLSKNFKHNTMMSTILQILTKTATLLGEFTHTTCKDDLCYKACQILGEVLSERCAVFQLNLKMYIENLKGFNNIQSECISLEQRISTVCDLFCKLLRTMPDSSWSVLPINELKRTVDGVELLFNTSQTSSGKDSLNSMMKDMLLLHEHARAGHTTPCTGVEHTPQHWNDSDYRKMPILPRWDEICVSQTHSDRRLRKIIVEGSYSDWLHYYDIHFRLLREDFLAMLRNGFNDFFKGMRGRQLKNVKIYKNVHLMTPFCSNSGICYKICIDISRAHCNWEHSKRLLFGSLLCLSPDNFTDQIYFATVVSRDIEDIARGELHIKFENTSEVLRLKEKSFVMVESCAYFEGSRHILRSLQTAEVNTMPFTKYLIAGECKVVNKPNYLLIENTGTTYNLSSLLMKEKENIFGEENYVDRETRKTNTSDLYSKVKDVSNIASWPCMDVVELDESQLKAVQNALTQEIAIIQGPPGTGKTYIGLKIVEILLNNRQVWNPHVMQAPILVMCYTNHALDQFLEGILDCSLFQTEKKNVDLVRIGSRSKSEKLNEFNIRHLRRKYLSKKSEAIKRVRNCKRLIQDILTEFNQSNTVVPCQELLNLMHPDHKYYFTNGTESLEQQQDDKILSWLGVLKMSHEQLNESHLKPLTEPLGDDVAHMHAHSFRGEYENITEYYGNPGRSKIQHGPDLGRGATISNEGYGAEKDKDSGLIDIMQEHEIESQHRILDEDDYAMSEIEKEKEFSHHQQRFLRPNMPNLKDNCSLQHYITEDDLTAVQVPKNFPITKLMPKMKMARVKNIGELSYDDRFKLFNYWHSLYQDQIFQKCEKKFRKYDELCLEVDKMNKEMDRDVLEKVDIIGMTTTGAAKYQEILHLVKPRIVIVEEAAEVLECHIVSALNAGTQHLILIGDHKQLRPKPNVYELAKKYRLDVSLFERLILNGHPHVTLTIQHRMRPEIAQLVKPHIYDVLFNHSTVESYSNVKGVSTNLHFINHDEPEHDDIQTQSHSNDHEAKYLVAFCKYLLQQNYTANQITVLVTYSGQLLAMRKLMPKRSFEGVRLSTVDNFQGEENDIILLSLVRSNISHQVGFLKEENRVCVALSRARKGFYCIGNFKMLRDQVPIWESIMSDMESKGKLGDGLTLQCNNHPNITFVAKTPKDFIDNSPNGGCTSTCLFRLQCGHVCSKICHVSDPEHVHYRCMKPCAKKCADGHPCKKPCYSHCQCKEMVQRTLPCSHIASMHCYLDPSSVECTKPCKQKCLKGSHICPFKCYEKCGRCMKNVMVEMPFCLHKIFIKCSMDPNFISCTANCSRKCSKGHACPKKCYEICGNCKVEVLKTIPGCNHNLKLPCCVEPCPEICTSPCEKVLPCKHLCPNKCYEPCGNCEVKVLKTISECGHKVELPCHIEPAHKNCTKLCEKLLPCKHKCELICGRQCSSKCNAKISKTWACGHFFMKLCHEATNPNDYPCKRKCKKKLSCEHPCPKTCGEPCDIKCSATVARKYPCGHSVRVSCSSTPLEHPCTSLCRQVLPCGHACGGQCSFCSSRNIHSPCSFSIRLKRFCGHQLNTKCAGLNDDLCFELILVSCSHGSHNKLCFWEPNYLSCDKPCEWKCVHFACSKTCSDICNRPPCNERCQQKLKCGHQCYGLCGEPCLTVCPKCDLKRFNEKLKSTDSFDPALSYFQLICRHIFTVKYLDELTQNVSPLKSPVLVTPLLCPFGTCSTPLSTSCRYGNAVKTSLSRLQSVADHIRVEGEKNKHNPKMLNELLCTRVFHSVKYNLSYYTIQKIIDGASKEEIFLTFMLFMTAILAEQVQTYSGDACGILEKNLNQHMEFIYTLKEKYNKELTYWLVNDLVKEFFKQCLTLQCLAIRHSPNFPPLDNYPALNAAEAFLEEATQKKVKVTRKDFQLHMLSMSEHSSHILLGSNMTCEKILVNLDKFYPILLKGSWWCCPEGHYYCTPALMCGTILHECPECKGKLILQTITLSFFLRLCGNLIYYLCES